MYAVVYKHYRECMIIGEYNRNDESIKIWGCEIFKQATDFLESKYNSLVSHYLTKKKESARSLYINYINNRKTSAKVVSTCRMYDEYQTVDEFNVIKIRDIPSMDDQIQFPLRSLNI